MLNFKLWLAIAFFQLQTVAYLALNRLGARLRSVPLLAEGDGRLPLRPRSLWLYLSFVPCCLMAVFDVGSLRRMLRLMACIVIEALISYRYFLKYPSAYPRPAFETDDAQLRAGWKALHEVDRPGNTFPSVHVGHTCLISLALSHHLPRERGDAQLLWALLIAGSTLLTKQHYLVDVTGGLLVAEAVATHVYEPWEEGRLSLRTAFRELRATCRRLDAMARNPSAYALVAQERHPRLAQLLDQLEQRGGVLALYQSCEGRHAILLRRHLFVRHLNQIERGLRALQRLVPGWLQFVRLLQQVEAEVTDANVRAYLADLEADLDPALRLLFGREAPGPGVELPRPQAADPEGAAVALGAQAGAEAQPRRENGPNLQS